MTASLSTSRVSTLPRAIIRLLLAASLLHCSTQTSYNTSNPARGPGQLLEDTDALNTLPLTTADDAIPHARMVTPPADGELPNCDGACTTFCTDLNLQNPLNRALCHSAWGVGLDTQPIHTLQACRRLHMDLWGRFPSLAEAKQNCEGNTWSQTVANLLQSDHFVRQCRAHWADQFEYNTTRVSVERIYDLDQIVERLCRGTLAYNRFAEVAASHPVLTRQHDTPGDRAEAAYRIFLGRSPFTNERSDVGRLYAPWDNDYYDSQALGQRLPDAWVRYGCIGTDEGDTGSCTSVLFGYNTVDLGTPDLRSTRESGGDRTMWSGLLSAEEWRVLQAPGRVLAAQSLFWEHQVDALLQHYMGYDLAREIPTARSELVQYLVDHHGDLRALHFAIATSAAYLQSTEGSTATDHRWTYGPLKQTPAEGWLTSLTHHAGLIQNGTHDWGSCDPRISHPEDFLDNDSTAIAYGLVEASAWTLDQEGQLQTTFSDYAKSLGGCPDNDPSGRFSTVSVLTTSTQLSIATELCDPLLDGIENHAANEILIPSGTVDNAAINPDGAVAVLEHQVARFFGRSPTDDEVTEIRLAGEECERLRCTAEEFARPLCYALLSSAEVLFY